MLKFLNLFFLISGFSLVSLGQKTAMREVKQQGFTAFVPNLGQWDADFHAVAPLPFGDLYLQDSGYQLILQEQTQWHAILEEFHLYKKLQEPRILEKHSLIIKFNNTKQLAKQYIYPANWVNNYFLGSDSSKWRPKVQPYYGYQINEIYPGIRYAHTTLDSDIKSEWHLAPHAKVSDISWSILGANKLLITENGMLNIHTSIGVLAEKKPEAWQIIDGKKETILVQYTLDNETLGFSVGEFNHNYPLIIDPVLVFSTYSGSVADNFGFTATYDSLGHLYAGGIAGNTSGSYPVNKALIGAFQDTFNGGTNDPPVNLPSDITISKYSSDGSQLLYATYIGGRLNDFPHSMVVNLANELYVLGTTFSNNFPTRNAYDNSYNGAGDIILFRFNEDCSQLLQSTYFGGSGSDGFNAPLSNNTLSYNYADDFRGDIYCDLNDNVYVATCTQSQNFPITDSASQQINNGMRDAAIFSFDSSLQKLRFSTLWGGSSDDAAYSVKLDKGGFVYVGGGTASTDFITTLGAYKAAYLGGRADGFVLKLDSGNGKIIASTTFGTASYDQVFFIDLDVRNRIYLAGQTEGVLTRTAGTYGQDNTSQFVACLDSTLSNLLFQTTFGNRTQNPELSPSAFLVDNCYNIYFSGWGSIIGVGHNLTTNGLQTKNANWASTDGSDFYLLVMNKEAKGLIYASFIGGTRTNDHVDGGTSRFDKNGIVYQSVCASCPQGSGGMISDFPTSANAIFPTNSSIRCSNASFKLDFEITYFTEAKFSIPTKICLKDTILFFNTGRGTQFYWDFGDGNKSNQKSPIHEYKNSGTYKITLIAQDSLACNLADTAYAEITVNVSPIAEFSVAFEPCNPGLITIAYTNDNLAVIDWIFDDGNTSSGDINSYRYAKDGEYKMKKIVSYPNGCKDTFIQLVNLSSNAGGTVKMYNIFSPNKDGLNDCWAPDGINKECETYETKIYNRNGTLVYNSEENGACWQGFINYSKSLATSGTYYAHTLIKRKDNKEKKEIYSVITLVR